MPKRRRDAPIAGEDIRPGDLFASHTRHLTANVGASLPARKSSSYISTTNAVKRTSFAISTRRLGHNAALKRIFVIMQ